MHEDRFETSVLILSLLRLKGVGTKRVQKVLLSSKDEIHTVKNYSELFVRDLNDRVVNKALDESNQTWSSIQSDVRSMLERAQNEGIVTYHMLMDEYPQRLLRLDNKPPIFFVKGNTDLLNSDKSIAVIGTRRPSDFGYRMGERLSYLLSVQGYTIVSGLAIGSDTAGHIGALKNNGKTIAILATGLGMSVHPKENQKLANQILDQGGLLFSEYEPYSRFEGKSLVSNLIARDEWQVGLSDGVIVIETGEHGGTHYAIQHALKQGMPVGMFDYSTKIKEEFYSNPNFAGNVRFLGSKEAMSIYEKESVTRFLECIDKKK